ncbi:dihydrolipoyl dehydrogenase [Candidatus Paracaedibacter symbiosus]|uniref:dihydrolipoyl dehydrogenase n=1 Tax=Candidatus Paracaedibacter symbiosus TaxID=244582 RepID=UPI0005094D96|nr:dihydrolipoyl dehydrogenase [Candidatus Paracaedibacter symbiosus]
MSETVFDLIVIGAGPGGYVAAIKAAQLGLKVAVVDKKPLPGGTCLNIGCIPSKALLNTSHKYVEAKDHFAGLGIKVGNVALDLPTMLTNKDKVVAELTKGVGFLFKKNGVTYIQGTATFQNPTTLQVNLAAGETVTYQANKIIIATGSEPASIPGVDVDETRIVSSTGALSLSQVPKHLVVIGGGYIGLELGSVWARLGAKVTVVEFFDRIVPMMDHEVGTALHKALTTQGISFKLQHKVMKIDTKGKELELHIASATGENAPSETIRCDTVLVATGRRPYTQNLGLDTIGVAVDGRGFIPVDHHYQTSCPGVYAIGDVILGAMLAHKAEEEGIAVAEILCGKYGHVNYDVIPAVIYTSPEVASVGLTEEQLKAHAVNYAVGKFPFLANSRAKTVHETTGFAKVLTDKVTDRVLGVHIIGEQAGNMIAEATLAMEFHASAEDIARTCHAHPTFSEALKEAALAAFDKPINM